MSEIKDITIQEALDFDKGIERVRDVETTQGKVAGCAFPFKISYKNTRIANKVKPAVKAFGEERQKLIEQHQVEKPTGEKDEDGKTIKDVDGKPMKNMFLSKKNIADIEKILEAKLSEIVEDLVLPTHKLSQFMEMEDDEYYKKANANSPVPQEFFSLMGRLIEDDTED